MKAKLLGLSVAVLALFLAEPRPAAAEVGDHCRTAIAPVREIDTKIVYTDRAGSLVDEDIADSNKERRAPLNAYITYIQALADDYAAKGDAWKRDCISAQLSSWARQDALVETNVTSHGAVVRMWAVGSLAAAAIKVYDCQSPPPPEVVQWFNKLSDITLEYLKLRDKVLKERSVANITYWVGTTLASISVVTQRKDLWDRARQIYLAALTTIGPDGTLKAELRRGSRASLYHSLAAEALVGFAALGPLWNTDKTDFFASEDYALLRLIRLIDTIQSAPQTLQKLANAEQVPISPPTWFVLLPRSGPYAEFREKYGRDARLPRIGGSATTLTKIIASNDQNALRHCLATRH